MYVVDISEHFCSQVQQNELTRCQFFLVLVVAACMQEHHSILVHGNRQGHLGDGRGAMVYITPDHSSYKGDGAAPEADGTGQPGQAGINAARGSGQVIVSHEATCMQL